MRGLADYQPVHLSIIGRNVICSMALLKPQPTMRTSCQPGLATRFPTSFQLVRLVGCGLYRTLTRTKSGARYSKKLLLYLFFFEDIRGWTGDHFSFGLT